MMGSITLHETLPNAEETETSRKCLFRFLIFYSLLSGAKMHECFHIKVRIIFSTSAQPALYCDACNPALVVLKGKKACDLLSHIAVSPCLISFFSLSAGFDYRLLLVPSTLVSAAKALLKSLPALVWYHAVKTLPTGIR